MPKLEVDEMEKIIILLKMEAVTVTEHRTTITTFLEPEIDIFCLTSLFPLFVYAINRDDNMMEMQLEANVEYPAVSNTKTTVESDSKNTIFQANHCLHFISNELIQFSIIIIS